MKAFATTFTLLAIVLAVILESAPTQAWRPQGRFGKRRMDQAEAQSSPNAVPEDHTASKLLGTLPSGYPEDLELPVFQYGKVICIHKGAKGIYRCVRWQDSEALENSRD